MFVCTRAISSTGGYSLDGYSPDLDLPKGAQLVDGPVEARKAAREQLSNGADWIKVYMNHRSWVDAKGNLVSQPTLTLGRARRRSSTRRTARDARSPATPTTASACAGRSTAGCDSIEHGLDLTDEDVAQMVRQGTWLVSDDDAVLLRVGAGRHAGRGEGPQARRGSRALAPEGREGRREDRLRHRRRQLLRGTSRSRRSSPSWSRPA